MTDSEKTFELKGEVEGARDVAGAVEVYVSHHSTAAQWYKNFRVEKPGGDRHLGCDGVGADAGSHLAKPEASRSPGDTIELPRQARVPA